MHFCQSNCSWCGTFVTEQMPKDTMCISQKSQVLDALGLRVGCKWTQTEFLGQAYGCVHTCLCVSLFACVSKIARRIYMTFSTQGHFASRCCLYFHFFLFVQARTPLKLWTNLTQSRNVERSLTESLKSPSALDWGHRKRKMRVRNGGEESGPSGGSAGGTKQIFIGIRSKQRASVFHNQTRAACTFFLIFFAIYDLSVWMTII